MKTSIFLVFTVLFLTACQEQTVSEQFNHVTKALPEITISTPDQLYIEKESGEPANGEFTSYHKDGSLYASLTFSSGLVVDGKISEAADKDANKVEWIFTKDNGVHVSTLLMNDVKVQQVGHGDRLTDVKRMRTWSPEGTPIADFSEYRIREWHPNGELKSKAEIDPDGGGLHGRVAAWYPDGQLSGESFYNNDLLNGPYREWDSEGNLVTDKLYEDGELIEG